MASASPIEWTDATWNPVRGCSRVSEGCRGCYAEEIAARFSGPGQPFAGFADRNRTGSKWTGTVALMPELLDLPLRWTKPRRIFVNSMSDLFHEGLSDEDIAACFGAMALAPRHIYQILTKRPDRMRSWFWGLHARSRRDPVIWCLAQLYRAAPAIAARFPPDGKLAAQARRYGWPLLQVWLGTSAEDQKTASERIPALLGCRAALHFVSLEPLLGPIDLTALEYGRFAEGATLDALRGRVYLDGAIASGRYGERLRWVIAGGESGHKARPAHPRWFIDLMNQCAKAGVPYFFKQWGAWKHMPERAHFKDWYREPWTRAASQLEGVRPALVFKIGKKAAGAELEGAERREWPQ